MQRKATLPLYRKSIALVHMAASGNIEKVKDYIRDPSVHLDYIDSSNRTALIAAAGKGHAKVVKLLLSAGVKIDKMNRGTLTALKSAILSGNARVVKVLIDAGANIEHMDKDRMTLLMRAIICNELEIVNILLDGGADINAEDDHGYTPLMHAADNVEMVQLLLDHAASSGIDVVEFVNDGEDEPKALARAIECENEDVIKVLVDAGARGRYVTTTRWVCD